MRDEKLAPGTFVDGEAFQERLPPGFVIPIPINRFAESLVKIDLLMPAYLMFYL